MEFFLLAQMDIEMPFKKRILSELSPIAQPAILKLDCVKVEMLQLILTLLLH
jgi:hypothetical protein